MAITDTLSRFLPQKSLRFFGARTVLGTINIAKGARGAVYQHGPLAQEMPSCAWREPPGGGIQVVAIAATFEESLPALQKVEAAVTAGKNVQSIFWPVRALRGGSFHLKKVPATVERDPSGLTFAPMALGTSPVRVPSTRMDDFLMGDRVSNPPNVPDAALPSAFVTHERLLTAARESGKLTRAEMFKAAVGIAWTRCRQTGADVHDLSKIRTALHMLQEGLAPVVDGREADAAHLARAHEAIETLVANDLVGKFGKAGSLFLSTEVGPLLALAEARKRAATAGVEPELQASVVAFA